MVHHHKSDRSGWQDDEIRIAHEQNMIKSKKKWMKIYTASDT